MHGCTDVDLDQWNVACFPLHRGYEAVPPRRQHWNMQKLSGGDDSDSEDEGPGNKAGAQKATPVVDEDAEAALVDPARGLLDKVSRCAALRCITWLGILACCVG